MRWAEIDVLELSPHRLFTSSGDEVVSLPKSWQGGHKHQLELVRGESAVILQHRIQLASHSTIREISDLQMEIIIKFLCQSQSQTVLIIMLLLVGYFNHQIS